jgi:tRNA-2-methylthio-N6-dimethylallyladenosine synthase
VKRIKKNVPGAKLSTDIIVGFPGEDEKAFQNTVEVCKKVKFDIAYINKYSPRKGTLSAKIYANNIPQSEKKRRWQVLNELVNKKYAR